MAPPQATWGMIRGKSGAASRHQKRCWTGATGVWEMRSGVSWNSLAPAFSASSLLDALLEKTTTSHPRTLDIWMARYPRPPTPWIPIRSPGLTPYAVNSSQIMAPPHIKVAVYLGSRPSGILTSMRSCHIACVAKDPTLSKFARCSQYCSLSV